MTATGRFDARLFGAGLAPGGEEARASVDALQLRVEGSRRLAVPLAALKAEAGGFDHDLVFLEFDDAGTRYSLQVAGAGLAAVRAHAPPELLRQLSALDGGVSRQRWLWRALFAAAAALGIAVGLLAWRYDDAVAWAADRISPDTERRLGQQVVAGLRGDGRLIEAGPTVQVVADIGNRLTAGSRHDYRWYVLIDKDINAFAAPGGVVVVHSGLIESVDSAAELAGVLAHEVQHVELRHTLRNMINAIGWAAVLTVALGDVNAIAAVLIHQAGTMRFSRELESEADAKGLEALRRAGLPAEGMVTFFRRLQKDDQGGAVFLSSHPATADRIRDLERAIAEQPEPRGETMRIDWPEVQRRLKDEVPQPR